MFIKFNCLIFESSNYYLNNIELVIRSQKKNIFIELLNYKEPKLFYFPLLIDSGIILEPVIFPLKGRLKNGRLSYSLSWVNKYIDIKKNYDEFGDYFFCKINNLINIEENYNEYLEQDLIQSVVSILKIENVNLENYINNLFLLPIKFKNCLLLGKEIFEKTKIFSEIGNENLNIMFNGQYYSNLKNLLNNKIEEPIYKYNKNNIKTERGEKYFYNEKKDVYNFLVKESFYKNITVYLNKYYSDLNNLDKILNNFYENKLTNFKLILFLISNNFKFKSENEYFSLILEKSNNIIEVKDFIELNDFDLDDLTNLKKFLTTYNKFTDLFIEKNKNKINFSLNYSKKDLDLNLKKILFLNLEDLKGSKLLNFFDYKLKKQIQYILNLDDLNKFFSNERIYRDYTIRILIKKLFLVENNEFKKNYNKFNFFRNYFYKSNWKSIIKNYKLINYLIENKDILLYYGRLNLVFFNDLNYKSLPNIIKNKFNIINFLDSQTEIFDFLKFMYQDLDLILENFTNLSNIQIKNLSKIIYLTKIINNQNLNDEGYNNFISLCRKNTNYLISQNKFNLKLKEFLPNCSLNLGIITKDILKPNFSNKLEDPFEENLKLKILYLKYRKKYSKYKAKYFLEKDKNSNKLEKLQFYSNSTT